MRTMRGLILSAAMVAASTVALAQDAPKFGRPLECDKTGASDVVLGAAGAAGTAADLDWALRTMASIGYPGMAPAGVADRDRARRVAALLRSGKLVAAKMGNDEARAASSSFGKQFGASFDALLTVLTQPVVHASYPTSVTAEGEQRGSKGQHTHGVDLEAASSSLSEVIARAQTSKKLLGRIYDKPAVRFYLLANGFRDDVALAAAGRGVCQLGLDRATVDRLNVSARYMAMPGRSEGDSK